ncbi:MAG: hypothetical protein P4L90_30110 [Rhodopila sp.]|nr:hypothetical protein [Rhodopila sp.]
MSITVVSTFRMDREHALRLAGKGAPIIKQHGATAVRLGFCHSGARTGTISVVISYPDWQTYGKAAQAMYEDKAFQSVLAEAMKAGELLERAIMVMHDL